MDTSGLTLGQRMAAEIRAEMARQGVSGRTLAERVGKNHVTVGRWLKGTSPMDLDEMDAVCRALDVTVADVLAATEHRQRTGPDTLRYASTFLAA